MGESDAIKELRGNYKRRAVEDAAVVGRALAAARGIQTQQEEKR